MIKHHFSEKESDITIISNSNAAILKGKKSFYTHRSALEKYILKDNEFLTSFVPVSVITNEKVVVLMAEAAYICEVGPMAAVAGAIADLMIADMKIRDETDYIPAKDALVENGGEIIVDSSVPIKIALYAGKNELNLNLGFLIEKKDCPIGMGTSSATIGHAISLGEADAVTIFAQNAALADAAATRIANLVKGDDIEKSIKKGLDAVDDIEGVSGAFISRKNKVGQVGKLPQMIKIKGTKELIMKDKLENMFPGDFEIFK
ncbi:MAG: UPF0280 family protein [Promethearchaeota archaeon]